MIQEIKKENIPQCVEVIRKSFATVANDVFYFKEGDTLIMPKDIPHAVYSEERFKMQLIVSF